MMTKNAKNTPGVAEVVDGLLAYVESADYAGYDPYDALNSPVIRLVGCKSKWARIASTQFLRRCPVNLRPVLGIRKGHNPKGIGLFLWGYAKLFRIHPDQHYLDSIRRLLDLLVLLRSNGASGNAWGYNFDWQSRTFFRPKGVPTIVNSAFIGHALLDCYEHTGLQQALDLAVPIKGFILNDLHRTPDGDAFCFSYTPVDTDVVHNANMLGASILIRLARHCGDSNCTDAALSSLAYSMRRQKEDGSWCYAENENQRWIDSFHTGFCVQALRYILDEGYAREYTQAYEKGVRFYAEHFFLADGTPKYYHDRTYPIDIHAPAQAICFFAGQGEAYRDLTERVLAWMLSNMFSPRGYAYFRKTQRFTNRIPYMRWSQAWALHALTEYQWTAARNEPLHCKGAASCPP
jgi:rhamnogalacturonyl hydrolase YesR